MQKSPDSLQRWGWASIGLNLFLTGLNLAIAYASGSLAVAAEMVHNLVDLVASVAVLVGLKLSEHKSRQFPYGLYKVENVVAAGVAILVFVAGYEIGRYALLGKTGDTVVTPWILGGVVLSMVLPLAFSCLEMRAGRAANSPSLVADALEYRVHMLTSGLVLLALLAHTIRLPLDRLAAAAIVLVVARTGWQLLHDAMRVLLDASLDSGTLARARKIVEQEPRVVEIHSLRGRNAGRYQFLEVEVEVRLRELTQADRVAQELSRKLREAIPHLEKILIEVKPSRSQEVRLALPLADTKGTASDHFGKAPFFLILDRQRADGQVLRRTAVKNPYAEEPRGRGIKVAHWLTQQRVDIVLSPDDIRGKGPGHALGEAGVDVVIVDPATAAEEMEQRPVETLMH